MYCNKCGATVEVDDKFCRACGTSTYSIKQIGEQNPWATSTPPPPPQVTIKNAPMIESQKDDTFLSFSKKWMYRVIIIVVSVMAIVLAKQIGQLLTDKYQASKFWENAAEEFEKTKEFMDFPRKVDEFTVVNNAFIKGHDIHYEYIVSGIELNASTKPEVEKVALDSFNKALCKNEIITKYDGASVYTYKFPNGDVTYRFTKSDCRP